jgi:hypothetical protein
MQQTPKKCKSLISYSALLTFILLIKVFLFEANFIHDTSKFWFETRNLPNAGDYVNQQFTTTMKTQNIGMLNSSRNDVAQYNLNHVEGLHVYYTSHSKSRNAIFTLMAGINPYESQSVKNYVSYLGYLIHLAAVRFLLDSSGSMIDFNILLRLQHGLPNNTLPMEQLHFFSKLRMNIIFLPQKPDGSWKSYTMEKFHVLRFQSLYDRVLFMDADVLPLCDLNHYFNLIEQGILAPNVIFAFNNEPSNAGLFLLSPEKGDWDRFNEIPDYLNKKIGFGIPLAEPAEGRRANYTDWSWQAVKEDQGMLFHWTRYVKKNVTMVKDGQLKKWRDVNGTVKMVDMISRFDKRCPSSVGKNNNNGFYNLMQSDFKHFTGKSKPWKIFNWSSSVVDEKSIHQVWKIHLWAFGVWKTWRKYNLGPLHQLIQNISEDLNQDIYLIQSFLDQN